jgi:hypothetical protein
MSRGIGKTQVRVLEALEAIAARIKPLALGEQAWFPLPQTVEVVRELFGPEFSDSQYSGVVSSLQGLLKRGLVYRVEHVKGHATWAVGPRLGGCGRKAACTACTGSRGAVPAVLGRGPSQRERMGGALPGALAGLAAPRALVKAAL